jgi:hypothetical protein
VSGVALWRPDGAKIVALFNRKVENAPIRQRLAAVATEPAARAARAAGADLAREQVRRLLERTRQLDPRQPPRS